MPRQHSDVDDLDSFADPLDDQQSDEDEDDEQSHHDDDDEQSHSDAEDNEQSHDDDDDEQPHGDDDEQPRVVGSALWRQNTIAQARRLCDICRRFCAPDDVTCPVARIRLGLDGDLDQRPIGCRSCEQIHHRDEEQCNLHEIARKSKVHSIHSRSVFSKYSLILTASSHSHSPNDSLTRAADPA